MQRNVTTLICCLVATVGVFAEGGKSPAKENFPASTQVLLDAVQSPASRGTIKSVLMIQCPKDRSKGTGFAVSRGSVITTNSHVVGNCKAEELVGVSPVADQPIKFVKMEKDDNRDLALLCAAKPMPFSLELNGDENPPVETEVETWGYPLRYQDPAPILSRGYVAGYRTESRPHVDRTTGSPVKHLIINGALNPGNSGGPLIDRTSGKVVGILVEKWTLFSPNIETAIQGFSHPKTMLEGTFSGTDAQGKTVSISDQEMTAIVLKEFYDLSQVMVGEAISVSELNAFVKEKRKDLACSSD
jgi:S1-C subfamily serine protease